MKTKPILITTSIVVLAVVIFLFVRGKSTGQIQKSEITQFLYGFTNRVNEGNKDSLLAYFEKDKNTKVLNRLVDLLIGKQSFGSKSSPLAHIRFNMDGCDLKIISTELATATIPVTFSHEPLDSRQSTLTLKIYKIAPHQFKIIQADARQFLTDYIAYENFVKSKTLTDKDIYSPITLEAFNTAHQLKSQYDSVIWFSHVNQKNYFYVVKGKWEGYELTSNIRGDTSRTYKMGLVGPDLKEIIPVEFDLVRNINGTFENLIEVEKGHKRGFYDLNGKNIVPVIYDQIFPINDDGNIAALRNGQNYYWLKSDYSISEKVDLKIADIVSKLKQVGSFSLTSAGSDIITEFNSRDEHGSIYLPPSYLVDLNLLPAVHFFKNPLRKNVEYEDVSTNYIVKADQRSEDDGWLQTTFYAIRDYFLGGRSEFYDKKNLVIIDKKHNKVFATEIGTDYSNEEDGGATLEGICDVNHIKIINDSLFEVKAGAALDFTLYDSTKAVTGGTYYHYLAVKDNQLKELPDNRNFGFTKYIKMDDSYLNGCYNVLIGTGNYEKRFKKNIDHLTPEILSYMKNEIYAEYKYQFKDKRWADVFTDPMSADYDNDGHIVKSKYNASVDDSLTVIDKYNINWINNKLKEMQKPVAHTLAAK